MRASIVAAVANLSKTQIDRLGERFRSGDTSEADVRLLDEYRRSFAGAYEAVASRIIQAEDFQLTGRPAKSTASIVDKLRRESVRLTQIQDVAGCRLIVRDRAEQNRVASTLSNLFPGASLVDRRERPSHHYRAVHIIAFAGGRPVEIQLRTVLQQKWAELSEKLSDVVDSSIKYGGGTPEIRELLSERSDIISRIEILELRLIGIESSEDDDRLRAEIKGLKEDVNATLSALIARVDLFKPSKSDR